MICKYPFVSRLKTLSGLNKQAIYCYLPLILKHKPRIIIVVNKLHFENR